MVNSAPSADSFIKVILVGPSGVGKTCLVSAYFDSPFEQRVLPTVAPAFTPAVVSVPDGMKVALQIWDTAGQERYQSISKMFYRDTQIAFVCFDVASQSAIDQWLAQLHAFAGECIVFLVSTKIDLISHAELSQLQHDGKAKADQVGAKAHVLTSARTGEGVKELFLAAAECYSGFCQPAFTPSEPVPEVDRPCC
jgi:small GTP-binding protein